MRFQEMYHNKMHGIKFVFNRYPFKPVSIPNVQGKTIFKSIFGTASFCDFFVRKS